MEMAYQMRLREPAPQGGKLVFTGHAIYDCNYGENPWMNISKDEAKIMKNRNNVDVRCVREQRD